jgi:hypothetical protein
MRKHKDRRIQIVHTESAPRIKELESELNPAASEKVPSNKSSIHLRKQQELR